MSRRSQSGGAAASGRSAGDAHPRKNGDWQMARSLRLAGWSLAMLTAVLLASGSASAQIGGIGPSGSPLGMTSPLGIGPAPAVPRTGIPMGATELSTPGVSPMTSGTSPLGAAPGNKGAALSPAPIPSVPVVAGVVSSQDVPIYLRGVGTVIAYNTVLVRSPIQGQITKITFTEGQTVHAGDLLAQIDP